MSSRNNPDQVDQTDRALEVGGRLGTRPSELLIETAFRKELEAQAGLFDAMGLADLAHTLVMMEAGIVPAESGRKLLAALLQLQQRPGDFALDPARGDLYTNREAWLADHTEAASWLGAGRARRETTTTAFLIKLRWDLLDLADALIITAQTLAGKAKVNDSTLMPDYTYLLAAQPTSFGHYLLGFVYPLLRDLDRLQAAYGRVDRSPAGCGSSNGSRLPQNRERLAELLGFEGLAVHARDAMWRVDLPIELTAMLTAALVNLDRLAEDLQIFCTEEFGLIEQNDRHARASKIMPQKKNPFALTHLRGLANTLIGTLTASAALGRTPSGQPDNRLPLYGLIPEAIDDTRQAVALMGEVVRDLRFDEQRARSRLEKASALATDLAEVLVLRCGLDFRQAHRLIGYWLRRHSRDGGFEGLTADNLAAAAKEILDSLIELSEQILRAALDLEAAVAARTEPGCAGPAAMAAMFGECEAALNPAAAWVEAHRRRLGIAEDALLSMAGQIAAGEGQS
jgi:argininosuccinate lyase